MTVYSELTSTFSLLVFFQRKCTNLNGTRYSEQEQIKLDMSTLFHTCTGSCDRVLVRICGVGSLSIARGPASLLQADAGKHGGANANANTNSYLLPGADVRVCYSEREELKGGIKHI